MAVDEASGLPVAMDLLHTWTTWACCRFILMLKRLGVRPRDIITDGLDEYASGIQMLFPSAKPLLCLFHHQQGVIRWLRDHVRGLPKKVIATRKMKRVVHTCDPQRHLPCLALEEGA